MRPPAFNPQGFRLHVQPQKGGKSTPEPFSRLAFTKPRHGAGNLRQVLRCYPCWKKGTQGQTRGDGGLEIAAKKISPVFPGRQSGKIGYAGFLTEGRLVSVIHSFSPRYSAKNCALSRTCSRFSWVSSRTAVEKSAHRTAIISSPPSLCRSSSFGMTPCACSPFMILRVASRSGGDGFFALFGDFLRQIPCFHHHCDGGFQIADFRIVRVPIQVKQG